MRYRLRTLLIALGVIPPVSAALWFAGPLAWLLLVLSAGALAFVYLWLVECRSTPVGTVLSLVVVLFTMLLLLGLLMPAVQ